MRVFLLGIFLFALSTAAAAQCPPDFAPAKTIMTAVELNPCADALRIHVCVTRTGLAADVWRMQVDEDRDGRLTEEEVSYQIVAERATISEYGLLLELEDGTKRAVSALQFEKCDSDVGLEADAEVRVQYDFVAQGFVPVAGRYYAGSLVVANAFQEATVLRQTARAGSGVSVAWTDVSLPLRGVSGMGRGGSGEFSFVVAAGPTPRPVDAGSSPMPMLFAAALFYFGLLFLATRRR